MPQKYLDVAGVPTFLLHTGSTTLPGVPPDLSRGEAVLCLHGIGGNAALFSGLLGPLAARHSPLAFDQPGHGRSGGLDSLASLPRMAEFTRSLLEALDVERPVLLGHSMGGALALDYALERPDEVRALVLCSVGTRFEISEAQLERLRRVTQGKERRPFPRELLSPSASPELLRTLFIEEMKTDPRARYGDLEACRDWEAGAGIGSLELPTLVLIGEDDRPELRESSERLASALPRARHGILPKAGHMLPLEAPEALASAVLEFLQELPA